jgi:hypothetical protein
LSRNQLEEEIESWKGFPWALRKEDRELWEAMVQEVTECFGDAVEKSGKPLTVDPFFMSLLIAQQRAIKSLLTELKSLGEDVTVGFEHIEMCGNGQDTRHAIEEGA